MIVYPYTVHYEVYKYKQMQEQLQYQLICKDVMLNLPEQGCKLLSDIGQCPTKFGKCPSKSNFD
jgi:hypothetical protein